MASAHKCLDAGAAMISKCANPACTVRFLYFHTGKLFRFEKEPREDTQPLMGLDPVRKHSQGVEFYWLCEKCAAKMTLTYRKGSGVIAQPLSLLKAAS